MIKKLEIVRVQPARGAGRLVEYSKVLTKFINTNGAIASEKPTVEQLKLPAGRKIGKLVVTRGGRVYLRAGGHVMDVAHTASENQHQSVIMIETARDVHAMQNGCGRFGDSAMYRDGSNAVYYLGQVRHHLTASLDWKQLRPVGMEVCDFMIQLSLFFGRMRNTRPAHVEAAQAVICLWGRKQRGYCLRSLS
ncbi:unnamed protein product [Cylicostephanus goldi]|uniref:Uncharacterized protein n=1 Tax=Cylicostephanus goldi TaxID=71465 RepID=A0A3P6R0F8_CYLGO|nr:unnamed protein product [Cylicostephanus goldi]